MIQSHSIDIDSESRRLIVTIRVISVPKSFLQCVRYGSFCANARTVRDGLKVLVSVTDYEEPIKKMVHLRYFKCNGRTDESASSLRMILPKSKEDITAKPVSPNTINPSSTNQLLINSNRPIHTVSASDGQVVRIVRQ